MGKRFNPATVLTVILFAVLVSSCAEQKRTTVKNYPVNRPFVYSNKIIVSGNLSKDEKKRLTTELYNYWEDSLRVRKLQQFGIFYKIKNPPVFDSANIPRSVNFMNAYLNSQGYYYAGLRDTVHIDTVKNQLRTYITMRIDVGKNVTIDSVSYNLSDSTLQHLTSQHQQQSFLKKGEPYTKQVIGAELDRLITLYRQNGYYNLNRDDLFALIDSVDTKLIPLTLDPFKQAEIIAEAAKRRKENPTWDIAIQNRPITDSSKFTQYHIGRTYYYPETKLSDVTDSLVKQRGFREFTRGGGTMRYKAGLFGYRPLKEHTYLHQGDLYNEQHYYKSINTLGQIGAWQQVDAKPVARDKDSLDLYFFLVPAIRQSFTVDLEGSRNTGDVLSGNTLGISTNLTYHNKNVWKQAIQSQASFRTGVELNLLGQKDNPLVQTFLASLGHTYAFPWLIQPFKNWKSLQQPDNKRTLLTVNGSYVDRRDFYQIRSLVTSWGYEWKKQRRNGDHLWLYKPLNVELYAIDKLPKLDTLILNNPFLQSSFNEGNIVSQSLSFIKTIISNTRKNKSHFIRIGVEEAGGFSGLIPGLKNNIYRYLKTEVEYMQSRKFLKSELAYHAFAGVGYNYGTDTSIGRTLPFFKQFVAGGPYSMRAWGLRQLGLGSSVFSDTTRSTYRDRFGDMRLEANVEYRFGLFSIGTFKVGSALYADIGNIWNIKKNEQDPRSQFSFRNLGRDLAVGVGTGLRFDFSYFLIRLDFAYKVKDPARQQNGGWMSVRNFVWTETRQNGLKVNNSALQIGIGLPF